MYGNYCMFCSSSSTFYLIFDKFASDSLKDEIVHYFKEKYSIQFALDAVLYFMLYHRNHDTNSHINYSRKNMNTIYYFIYLYLQY